MKVVYDQRFVSRTPPAWKRQSASKKKHFSVNFLVDHNCKQSKKIVFVFLPVLIYFINSIAHGSELVFSNGAAK
jgi:hypothetical protein